MVGQGRRSGLAPLGLPGGDRPSRQGDRHGGQGGGARRAAAAISKAEASQRVKLQTDYAQAVLWSKGYAADETKAAFERTSALAARAELPAERFSALYGRFLWSWTRGEFRVARDIAERFLREAEAEGRIAEARVAHIALGLGLHATGRLARGANPTRTGA